MERKIWTSPFHTSHNNIMWWAIFGGATAALIAADQTPGKSGAQQFRPGSSGK
jgi:hypothetical protein